MFSIPLIAENTVQESKQQKENMKTPILLNSWQDFKNGRSGHEKKSEKDEDKSKGRLLWQIHLTKLHAN